ncbi:MAG: outer membrane beta-barrel protein [Bacteroidia bacterium]|nr:outer membrane beta-barrel protein [Bacteroidia bacterium]
MKKIFLLATAAMVLVGLNSYGQDPDTSKIRVGNKKYKVIVDNDKEIKIITEGDSNTIVKERHFGRSHDHGKRMDGTWAGFEMGLTNFINRDFQFKLPDNGTYMDLKVSKSMEFNFNIAEKSLGLIKNYVGIVTGLGFQFRNYRFSENYNLFKDDNTDKLGHELSAFGEDMIKNRLTMWYLTVPLMMEFQIPVYGESTRVKLSAGVVGGLRLGSHQVQKYVVDGDKKRNKVSSDFYLRNFNYCFTARVGYGDMAVFANYYPQTLFENGKGPAIYPVTIGLHFGG